EFSGEVRVLEGELQSIAWRNPHPSMTLRVTERGQDRDWTVQVLGNINGLRRNGVTGEIFTLGERVRITGQASMRRTSLLLGTQVRFSDGTVAMIGPDESTGQAIYRGRLDASVAGAPGSADSTAEPDGIFRVWLVAERFRNPDLPLQPAARAAKEAWDSVTDDPQIGCRPLGMPGAMMSPHPIEFLDQDGDIVLRLEEWDATRRIHMSAASPSDGAQRAAMGYSVGRWDGRTLVVTTDRIDYPFMDEHGTPQSDAVTVVERFALSPDERSLDYEAIVTDPGTMTEPVVAFATRWEWVPGESIQPYECAVLELPQESPAESD
ncbi:MAG TPA: hypothetical protein VLD39_03950, partial [Gammaproteobacteria bacterium]|nr:hypothetical protein [Gammaproteobacteria bacterium]